MSFKNIIDSYQWDDVEQNIKAKTTSDVEIALGKDKCSLEDFKALVSPAALPYLEVMAQKSNNLTLKRFGKTMQLYIPLYLSNICYNSCVYCGFSHKNNILRKILTDEEIIREAETIKSYGFDHILLVTGDSPKDAGVTYLQHAIRLVSPYFSHISCEVQPLEQSDYELLIAEGLTSVYIYQETYHKENYPKYHPKGEKSDFYYRLDTPDRLGRAGIYKIGLGTLIGLEDWRTDSFFTALHLNYLERTYWKTKYSISFPRLRPFAGGFAPNIQMSDKELGQIICAFRIFNSEVELSLSTRESERLRDNLIHLGITAISAGSKTNPGGYAVEPQSLEQFEVSDNRTPLQIAEMLKKHGYEPVWKDWDKSIMMAE
jgi:2-iminoacetate synthase